MKKHKIIDHLKHYYQIQNANFKEGDHQTATLLNNYEKIIFNIDISSEKALNKGIKLDQIIHQYLNDVDYRSLLLKKIDIFELVEAADIERFIEDIISFDHNYQMEFYNTRIGSWI